MSNITWKKLSETATKVGYRTILTREYEMPDSSVHQWDVIKHPGAAGVVALTKDNKVIVARQYRPGQDAVLEDIPGGMIDPGEDAEQTVRRELLEETGYVAGNVSLLATMPRDGYMTGTWYYYLATDCELSDEPRENDEHEFIEIDTISLDKFYKNVYEGKMTDVAAGLFALRELEKRGMFSEDDIVQEG